MKDEDSTDPNRSTTDDHEDATAGEDWSTATNGLSNTEVSFFSLPKGAKSLY